MNIPLFRKKYFIKFAGGDKSLVIVKQPRGGYALYGLIRPDRADNNFELTSMIADLEKQFGKVVQQGEIRETGSVSRAAKKLIESLGIKFI